MGIRNPAFAHCQSACQNSLVVFTEVNILAQRAIRGDESLRHQPIDFRSSAQPVAPVSPRSIFNTVTTPEPETTQSVEPVAPLQSEEKSKGKLTDRFRSLIGSMFDE